MEGIKKKEPPPAPGANGWCRCPATPTRGSLPAPATSPWRSLQPQLGGGSAASVSQHLQIPSTRLLFWKELMDAGHSSPWLFVLVLLFPSTYIHSHTQMARPPTETRLPPPSCSGAYEDSQCLQHVMSHLSWTCSFPLPTAHTSPRLDCLSLSPSVSLSHTYKHAHYILFLCSA